MDELKSLIVRRKEEIINEKSFIHSKIDIWVNKLESEISSDIIISQKKKELIDLGKFIFCFNHDIKILDGMFESPDFLVSLGDKNIGIELTDLVIRDSEKEKEGLIRNLFRQIEAELRNDSNKHNGIYRIDFIDNISFKGNANQLKLEILNLIKENKTAGIQIKNIRKTPHTGISIYHSEASVVGPLDRKTVEDRIKKKEQKIEHYLVDSLNEIWLLLMTGGVQTSDDYSFIEEKVFNIPYESNFDRIFLLNFFESNILELKTSK